MAQTTMHGDNIVIKQQCNGRCFKVTKGVRKISGLNY